MVGCKSSQKVSENSTSVIVKDSIIYKTDSIDKERIAEFQKQIYIYKDSLSYITALQEKSSNIVFSKDTSFLQTSYAKSLAWIDSLGKLHHVISNKNKIPANIKYITKIVEVSKDSTKQQNINKETLNNKSSTQDKNKKQIIQLQPTFEQKAKIFSIGFILGLGVCSLTSFLIKWIRKKHNL